MKMNVIQLASKSNQFPAIFIQGATAANMDYIKQFIQDKEYLIGPSGYMLGERINDKEFFVYTRMECGIPQEPKMFTIEWGRIE